MDETPRRLGLHQAPTARADEAPTQASWDTIHNQPHNEPTPPVRSIVKEILEAAIFVLLVVVIFRGAVQNFKVEGSSMQPTMHTNQYILVSKIVYFHFDMNAPLRLLPGQGDLPPQVVYPFHMPRRGEVVVFEFPGDRNEDYIKRVIGLPGETIEIRDGNVYVNGVVLDEPYLRGAQTSCRPPRDACSNGPVVVPQGTVFVMGDNRANSSDSREWDALPLDRIIGRAWLSYWPQEDWGPIQTPTYASHP